VPIVPEWVTLAEPVACQFVALIYVDPRFLGIGRQCRLAIRFREKRSIPDISLYNTPLIF
jgi:hypothetical protein